MSEHVRTDPRLAVESRVAGLEAWVDGHEKLCAERYAGLRDDARAIREENRSIRDDLKAIVRVGVAVLIALVGWTAVQLWTGVQARLDEIPKEATR